MKTRIKVVEETTNGSLESRYYPQYKWLLIWLYFSQSNETVVFGNIEDAQKFIDEKPWAPVEIYKGHKIYCKRSTSRSRYDSAYYLYSSPKLNCTYGTIKEVKERLDDKYPTKIRKVTKINYGS